MRSVFVEKPEPEVARAWTSGVGWLAVWLPVVVAVMLIAGESTDTMSANHTSGWLRPLFEKVFGRFTDAVWGVLHHYARKTGHFVGYGIVCLTLARAWLLTLARRVGLHMARWRWEGNGLGVASTAVVASLDEWHQTFIPSRTGMVSDAVLDTVGGIMACVLVWAVCAAMRTGGRPSAATTRSREFAG